MRAVLDTNVWVSALIYSPETGPLSQILAHLEKGDFVLVTSPALVDEFIDVLDRHHVPKVTLRKWLNLLKRTRRGRPPLVFHVRPKNQIAIVFNDPDDDRVLECAVEGQADFIVTGDKDLLRLNRFQNVTIIPPRAFIEYLGLEK